MVSHHLAEELKSSTSQKDKCQGRCIHPEHVVAVKEHVLPADQALHLADLFSLLGGSNTAPGALCSLTCFNRRVVCLRPCIRTGSGRDDHLASTPRLTQSTSCRDAQSRARGLLSTH